MSLLELFFKELNEKAINYCHWKSIDRMDEVMHGKTDIDILIDYKQTATFNTVLSAFNAIAVRPRSWMTYPAMEDYILYDKNSGLFYHIHLHYKLIMGKKNAKEYILPLEKTYLETRMKHHKYDTYVVNPELDLIMLLLRYSVKYTYSQKKYQHIRGLKVSEIKELDFLRPRCTQEKLLKYAKEVDDKLQAKGVILNFFKKSYYKTPLKKIKQLTKLKQSILLYKRSNTLSVYIIKKARKYLNLYAALGRNNAKHPVHGGITIALVGCDGSGKTTVTNTIIKDLRVKLSARKYYMGFNARSFSIQTKVLALISYAPRGAKFILKGNLGKKINLLGQLIIEYGGYLDRKKLYIQSIKDKANGMIGFYERFPLKNTIDYPQCLYNEESLRLLEDSKLLTKLKDRLEFKYKMFEPADVNIFINTPTKVIRERRAMSDKTFEKVCRKYNRVENYINKNNYFVTIDGQKPLEDVVLNVKNVIFKQLC